MLLLLMVDIVLIQFSSFLGLWIRFDMQLSNIPTNYIQAVKDYAPFYILFTIIIFFLLRLYSFMWKG